MKKKVLITGITGQDGSYLAEFLLTKEYQVYGMIRRSSINCFERIKHILNNIELVYGDLLDQISLIRLIDRIRPDEIYNLAAQSFVPLSFDQMILTSEYTALGVNRILEAIRLIDKKIKFYQASSSEMFGNANEFPQDEETPLRPRNPYGVAKTYAHWITKLYREGYGLFACSGILFNHESPRRGKEFVTRKITETVAKIKLGLTNELLLGNLEAKRDWGYAGDYVEAMWKMLQYYKPDDYVIATGATHKVKDFVRIAFQCVNLNWEDYVRIDQSLIRPTELDLLCGNARKARKILNWKPKMKFEELIALMVNEDLNRMRI